MFSVVVAGALLRLHLFISYQDHLRLDLGQNTAYLLLTLINAFTVGSLFPQSVSLKTTIFSVEGRALLLGIITSLLFNWLKAPRCFEVLNFKDSRLLEL